MTAIPVQSTTPPSTAGALPASSTGSTESDQASSALASDFDTFLQLLTAQLRNQDPLEPVDSTQFVEQLASFSQVEQQIRSNTLLESLTEALGAGSTQLTDWVGYEIEAQAPLRFDGETPIELRVEPNPDAVAAVLVVRAEDGTVVARTPIDPADTTPVWDGTNSDGDTADPGLYSFAVQRSAGSEALPAETPRGFSLVTEARLENGEVVLVLDGGTTQRAEDVTALRSAS